MKYIAYLFCLYLFSLNALPSVRALKLQFTHTCPSSFQTNQSNTNEPSGCEKGKIIMNLSFNPVIYETSELFTKSKTVFIKISEKANLLYKEVFISQYESSIWQPPKIIFLV